MIQVANFTLGYKKVTIYGLEGDESIAIIVHNNDTNQHEVTRLQVASDKYVIAVNDEFKLFV